MRKASIDIGSNSLLLLVADLNGGQVVPVAERFYTPRLGSDLSATNRLADLSMEKAIAALGDALEVCRENETSEILAVATAAVREAENSRNFIDGVKQALGLTIKTLSGEEEATLSFIGAVSGLGEKGRQAVLDVGGGSTECTVGVDGLAKASVSVPIGAVKLVGLSDTLNARESENGEYLRNILKPVVTLAQGHDLIGVGGTITTLASVHSGLQEYKAGAIEDLVLQLETIDSLINHFGKLSTEEIAALPGMDPSRADIIEAGATIIRTLMAEASLDKIRVSTRGLRYGVLIQSLNDA